MLLAAAVAKCAEQEEVIQRLKRVVARLKELLRQAGTFSAFLAFVTAHFMFTVPF